MTMAVHSKPHSICFLQKITTYLKCLNLREFKSSREFNFANATYFFADFTDLNFTNFANGSIFSGFRGFNFREFREWVKLFAFRGPIISLENQSIQLHQVSDIREIMKRKCKTSVNYFPHFLS